MQTDSPNVVLSENGKFYTMNCVLCVASLKVSEIYSSCVHVHTIPDWCDNESETTQLLYRGGYITSSCIAKYRYECKARVTILRQ